MDIQVGDRVTYKKLEGKIVTTLIGSSVDIDSMKEILETRELLKIERQKYEVLEEKKELLTEEEKEFLKSYIKFTNYIPNKICKDNSEHRILFYVDEYLRDKYEFFGTFKNLEDSKIYTLKELGLV